MDAVRIHDGQCDPGGEGDWGRGGVEAKRTCHLCCILPAWTMSFSIQMFLISPVPDSWQRMAALRKHGTFMEVCMWEEWTLYTFPWRERHQEQDFTGPNDSAWRVLVLHWRPIHHPAKTQVPLWTPQSLSQQHHCQPHPCPLPHTQAHTHRHPGAPNNAQLRPLSLQSELQSSHEAADARLRMVAALNGPGDLPNLRPCLF